MPGFLSSGTVASLLCLPHDAQSAYNLCGRVPITQCCLWKEGLWGVPIRGSYELWFLLQLLTPNLHHDPWLYELKTKCSFYEFKTKRWPLCQVYSKFIWSGSSSHSNLESFHVSEGYQTRKQIKNCPSWSRGTAPSVHLDEHRMT